MTTWTILIVIFCDNWDKTVKFMSQIMKIRNKSRFDNRCETITEIKFINGNLNLAENLKV